MVKSQTRTYLGLQGFQLQFELIDLFEQGVELLVPFCPRAIVVLRNFDADWLFHGAKVIEKDITVTDLNRLFQYLPVSLSQLLST